MKTTKLSPATTPWRCTCHGILFLIIWLALMGTVARGAVVFSVTPGTVSNTYNRSLTLQITGLATGDTVLVQKYLDMNNNGFIDAGDWMVQQFSLTDGQGGMVIAGVTNLNVPGDTDPTVGQITAKLGFITGDFMQNIGANYLYKLSSPAGNFSPLTNLFTVANVPYAQTLAGNVVSNGTSTPVPNALVLLFPPPRPGKGGPSGQPLAGAVANNSGGYTIPAPPGTYMVLAFGSNCVSSFSAAPVVTLGSGAAVVTNLTVTNATAVISGKVVDAINSSAGLPGILVPAMASDGSIAVAFTDTNGNFSVGVQPGRWSMNGDGGSLNVHGYVGLDNGITANAGASGVLVPVPKATALFYGSVQDTQGNPLAGIDVYANDQNNQLYQADGYSRNGGGYVTAVLGGLGVNDPWGIGISPDGGFANYVFSRPNFGPNSNGTNVAAGTATLINFTGLLATNQITGNLQAYGTNMIGVGVWASATINGVNFFQYVDTDANGNYSLNIGNGAWSVGVETRGGSDSLDTLLGAGTYEWPGSQNVGISNRNATVNFVILPCNGVQISTTNLPDGRVGAIYGNFLQGSDCTGNLIWTVNDPGNMPPGLSLAGNQIQGIPSSSGTFQFTVHLEDGNGHSTNQLLALYIAPASGGVQITTTALPNGNISVLYGTQLNATGGPTPYSWSLSPGSDPLPGGLGLSTAGFLSGFPTTAGVFNFSVRAMDNASNFADRLLSVSISPFGTETITLKSDASTLAAVLGPGAPSNIILNQLDAGDTSGLTFQPVSVGSFGSYTPVPSGAPSGTLVVNLPPGDGESGFFKFTFVLPAGFQFPNLIGKANVDDLGRVFLNGNPISPSLNGNSTTGMIVETGDTQFAATNAAWFKIGTNELILADANTGGGPSGAAFYAVVAYLTNIPPFVITSPARPDAFRFQFSCNNAPGYTFTMQYANSLNTPLWTTFLITNSVTAGSFIVVDANATNSQRYYRVLVGP